MSQIGGSEKCDYCVDIIEQKLDFQVDTGYLCVSDSNDVPYPVVTMHQSGRKCVIVASALRAEQGPCEPIKGYIRKIREQ